MVTTNKIAAFARIFSRTFNGLKLVSAPWSAMRRTVNVLSKHDASNNASLGSSVSIGVFPIMLIVPAVCLSVEFV